jgi:hypothetical protein
MDGILGLVEKYLKISTELFEFGYDLWQKGYKKSIYQVSLI